MHGAVADRDLLAVLPRDQQIAALSQPLLDLTEVPGQLGERMQLTDARPDQVRPVVAEQLARLLVRGHVRPPVRGKRSDLRVLEQLAEKRRLEGGVSGLRQVVLHRAHLHRFDARRQ